MDDCIDTSELTVYLCRSQYALHCRSCRSSTAPILLLYVEDLKGGPAATLKKSESTEQATLNKNPNFYQKNLGCPDVQIQSPEL